MEVEGKLTEFYNKIMAHSTSLKSVPMKPPLQEHTANTDLKNGVLKDSNVSKQSCHKSDARNEDNLAKSCVVPQSSLNGAIRQPLQEYDANLPSVSKNVHDNLQETCNEMDCKYPFSNRFDDVNKHDDTTGTIKPTGQKTALDPAYAHSEFYRTCNINDIVNTNKGNEQIPLKLTENDLEQTCHAKQDLGANQGRTIDSMDSTNKEAKVDVLKFRYAGVQIYTHLYFCLLEVLINVLLLEKNRTNSNVTKGVRLQLGQL